MYLFSVFYTWIDDIIIYTQKQNNAIYFRYVFF